MLTAGGHQTDLTWCDETLQQEDQKKKEEDERAKQLAEAEKNKKQSLQLQVEENSVCLGRD